MFFVAKEKIGTVLGQQKEYTACTRRGFGFTSHAVTGIPGHSVWHYMFPIDAVEPSVRAQFEPEQPAPQGAAAVIDPEDSQFGEETRAVAGPTHILWSQEVAPGEMIGEPLITAFSGEGNWMAEAKAKFAARNQQQAA